MALIYCPPLPSDTAHAAELAFGRDHPYLQVGAHLTICLADLGDSEAILAHKTLAASFWPYAVMTILQFHENLTDRQSADATRTRVELKYALHLPLGFSGFTPMALCQFRRALMVNPASKAAFQELSFRLVTWMDAGGKRRADADQILTTCCALSRAEIVIETMSNAVEALTSSYPEWLRSVVLPHWYECYDKKHSLMLFPRPLQKTQDLLRVVGEDGQRLLEVIDQSGNIGLERLPEILNLRQEWQRQFATQNEPMKSYPVKCASCIHPYPV